MAVDYLPFAFHFPEQIRLVPAIMNPALILLDNGLYLDIRDSPREIAFDVSLDIGEREFQTFEGVTFRFDMVLNEIGQTFILPSGFNVASPRKIKKVLSERRAVGLLPACLDRVDDCN